MSLDEKIKAQKKIIRKLQIADTKERKRALRKATKSSIKDISKENKTSPPAAKLVPSTIDLQAISGPQSAELMVTTVSEQLKKENLQLEKLNSEVEELKADGTSQERHEREQIEV